MKFVLVDATRSDILRKALELFVQDTKAPAEKIREAQILLEELETDQSKRTLDKSHRKAV